MVVAGKVNGIAPQANASPSSFRRGRSDQEALPGIPATPRRKFRLKAPELSEREIHEACASMLDKLLLPPAMWCCYPAGAAQLSPQQQARYSRVGLKRGFPDILIFCGHVYGIELKRRGGVLSKTRIVRTKRGAPRILDGQIDIFPKLLATGAFAAINVAYSVDDVVHWLDVWGVPHR